MSRRGDVAETLVSDRNSNWVSLGVTIASPLVALVIAAFRDEEPLTARLVVAFAPLAIILVTGLASRRRSRDTSHVAKYVALGTLFGYSFGLVLAWWSYPDSDPIDSLLPHWFAAGFSALAGISSVHEVLRVRRTSLDYPEPGDAIGDWCVREVMRPGPQAIALSVTKGQQRGIAKLLPIHRRRELDSHRRFRSEARNLGRVRSHYVPRLFETGWSTFGPFVVLEHIDGKPLDEALAATHHGMSVGAVQRLAYELAAALHAMHAAKVIHRDVSPGNVLTAAERTALIDFGLSRAPLDSRITRVGSAIGTPGYMAPEQLTGSPTERSDVFAWALIVVFAATGSHLLDPSQGDATFRAAELTRHSELPTDLSRLVEQALHQNPRSRPTASEIAGALGSPMNESSRATAAGLARRLRRLWPPRLSGGFALLVVAALMVASIGVAAALRTATEDQAAARLSIEAGSDTGSEEAWEGPVGPAFGEASGAETSRAAEVAVSITSTTTTVTTTTAGGTSRSGTNPGTDATPSTPPTTQSPVASSTVTAATTSTTAASTTIEATTTLLEDIQADWNVCWVTVSTWFPGYPNQIEMAGGVTDFGTPMTVEVEHVFFEYELWGGDAEVWRLLPDCTQTQLFTVQAMQRVTIDSFVGDVLFVTNADDVVTEIGTYPAGEVQEVLLAGIRPNAFGENDVLYFPCDFC